MATVEWTDERLNDAFEALRRDISDLRIEIRDMRAEMHAGFRALWMALVASYVSLQVTVVGAVLAIHL
jgi:hypothetical protein